MLVLLLLNDWCFKYAFPGAITGKLSDFAGIALVGTLAIAIWPKRTYAIRVAVVAGFIWWKGPLSQVAIDAINRMTPFHVGRTVDYTDLVALCVLAVCPHFSSCANQYSFFSHKARGALRVPLFAAIAFSIMGTSTVPVRDTYSIRRTAASIALERNKVAEAIDDVMKNEGLVCRDCSRLTQGATYTGNGLNVSYSFKDGDVVFFEIYAWPGGMFFGPSGTEKADILRRKLKTLLGERFSGLEYVEPLGTHR